MTSANITHSTSTTAVASCFYDWQKEDHASGVSATDALCEAACERMHVSFRKMTKLRCLDVTDAVLKLRVAIRHHEFGDDLSGTWDALLASTVSDLEAIARLPAPV